MIKFLTISQSQANYLASKSNETYTPGFDTEQKYYFYKSNYTQEELRNTIDLPQELADGLTPVDPTKPMFPRKK